MHKPWTKEELTRLVNAITPLSEKFNLIVGPTKDLLDAPHYAGLDFHPISKEDLAVPFIRALRVHWGRPEILKSTYDGLFDENDGPAGIRRAQAPRGNRVFAQHAPQNVVRRFAPDRDPEHDEPEPPQDNNERLLRELQRAARYQAEPPANQARVGADYIVFNNEDPLVNPNLNRYGAPPSKSKKQPSCRFKLLFTRNDGGLIYTTVY